MDLTSLDVLWPPLFLLTGAALLRSGSTLLDRLIIALSMLLGATCVAGLIFSVWPWHLAPVPVAGAAGTILALTAAITHRRPALPRPTWADAIALTGALIVVIVVGWPYLTADNTPELLSYTMVGRDNARHLQAFEGIRAAGGYLFYFDPSPIDPMAYYPQGWHMATALLANFAEGTTSLPSPLDGLRFYQYASLATYGLAALVACWAVGWIAGRALTLPRRIAATALVVSVLAGSQLVRAVTNGYTAEMMGLAIAAFLIAILARPLRSRREQLLAVALALVSIGFSYYLFLPPLAIAAAFWLMRRRRHALTHKPTLAATLALAALSVMPAILGLINADQGAALSGGPSLPTHPVAVCLVGVVVAASLLARTGRRTTAEPRSPEEWGFPAGRSSGWRSFAGWRSPVWRGYAWLVTITVAFIGTVVVINLAQGSSPSYFAAKSVHLLLLELAIGTGAITLLLPAPWTHKGSAGKPLPGRLAVAWVVVLAVVIGSGVFTGIGPFAERNDDMRTVRAHFWLYQAGKPQLAATVVNALTHTEPSAYPTMVVSVDAIDSYEATLFLGALHRTPIVDDTAIYKLSDRQPDRIIAFLRRTTGPVRLVAVDADASALIETALAENSSRPSRVTIVRL